MIIAQIKFGRLQNSSKNAFEDIAETYLATLLKGGQICGDYLVAWYAGVLNAQVQLAGPDAFRLRNHTGYGRKELANVRRAFGASPGWKLMDDNASKRLPKWKLAPFLYLFTTAYGKLMPVSSGLNGIGIPTYTFPITDDQKEKLYFWQQAYRVHDRVWMESGALELPAYRQLADPESELSQKGRNLGKVIQAATRVPTYYYLMRFWGRPKGEDARKCPGCHGEWRVNQAIGASLAFHDFHFRCDKCRLVSHLGVSTDGGRYARIGE